MGDLPFIEPPFSLTDTDLFEGLSCSMWANERIPGITPAHVKVINGPITRDPITGIKDLPENLRAEAGIPPVTSEITNRRMLQAVLAWQREVTELMKTLKSTYEENQVLTNKIKEQEERISELESGAGPAKKARTN